MGPTERAVNVLAKWRVLLAGWQVGTRPKGDPEGDAIRDHREVSLLMRCEISAITGLLIEKGVITHEEFDAAIRKEAGLMNRDLEERFPGVTADLDGLHYDARVHEWMGSWKP